MATVALASCNDRTDKYALDWKESSVFPSNNNKPSIGYAGPVAGYLQNKIVVGGGANFPDGMPWLGGKKKYYDDLFVFAVSDTGLQLTQQLKLPDTVAYAASCTTPSGIVFAGGENQNGISQKVWMISQDDSGTIRFTSLPDLPLALTNAAMAFFNHQLFLAGGESPHGTSASCFSLDLNSRDSGWKELAPLPLAASHGVFVAMPASLYFIGGRKKTGSGISDLYNAVYAYDPLLNKWSRKTSLPYALSAGTGIAFSKNEIALFGGDKGNTFHQTEELIAAISNEKDAVKKNELTEQKAKLQSSHPGFSNEILIYNTDEDKWQVKGTIPFVTPVTTTAFEKNNTIYIPSGEIKAGVRSPYMLTGRRKN